ncbi:MAG: minor capsid protein [Armatimonadota bacterium]|nr:minor capsid protein [bacterium]
MNTSCAVIDSKDQANAIREATGKSLMARDMYTEQVAYQLTQSLKSAQDQVQKALLNYKGMDALPDNKLAAVNGLEKLNAQIQEAMTTLHKEQSLVFKQSNKAAFRKGIYQGIEEFAAAQMPFYKDLKPDGIDKLTTSVFTLIDTDALDFLANYNLVLVGDIGRELESGIKRTILSGITSGKSVRDIVRDMGTVIENKDSFRNAGSKVFTKAQYRMEMIARTEVLRAHNQGRIKFHKQVGVQKLEWMTMDDERMCPVCGELDGKQFDIDRLPNIPSHPQCRCVLLPAWPLDVFDPEPTEDPASISSIPPNPDAYKVEKPTELEFKLHDEFWEQDGKIIESLSPSEHWSLRAYIRQMCDQIVSQSRGTLNDPRIQQHVDRIKAILDRSELSRPIRVYRGDKRLPNDSEKAKEFVGKKLENPGFLSTSISALVGNQFSTKTGGIIEIDLPEGIHALYAGAFWRSKLAVKNRKKGILGECEILLPPGVDFEITNSRVEETIFGNKVVYTAKPIFKPEHMVTKADLMAFLLWTYAAFGGSDTAYILSPRIRILTLRLPR